MQSYLASDLGVALGSVLFTKVPLLVRRSFGLMESVLELV